MTLVCPEYPYQHSHTNPCPLYLEATLHSMITCMQKCWVAQQHTKAISPCNAEP